MQSNQTKTQYDELLQSNGQNKDQNEKKEAINLDTSDFERDVILKPSPVWSRAMTWSIVGVTTFAVAWAYFAKIEQVVGARGQLKPKTDVQEIQAPLNGVVSAVQVEDGQKIQEGDSLVTFDSDVTESQLTSLETIRNSLIKENRFYRTLLNTPLTPAVVEQNVIELELTPEIQALALNRQNIVQENDLFSMQLGEGATSSLSGQQIARLNASNNESESRSMVAQFRIEQLQKQLNQNQLQLQDTRQQLVNDRQVLAEIQRRNRETIAQAEESLKIDQKILDNIAPLSEEGAVSQIQTDLQRQRVQDRRANIIQSSANGQIEAERQRQQVETRQAEIQQLEEERQRINLQISQGEEELRNTLALTEKDIRDRIAGNNQRLAEIDSQINKVVVDNEKRIAELNSQISSAQQTIKYQELKSPVSGTVFDLQAHPGFVPRSGQSEALLKIVPDPGPNNPLVAEAYITNADIGFVQLGQEVDVRIDSFSYSEFGDIKGEVTFIGSDALPPDQLYNFYRFPVKVELAQQNLLIRGEPAELQSGMSVSVNIKVRENRTVLSLFTELFTKKVDSLKQVR